jgi:drug/metabolite transporter (DMT)-like permease
MYLMNPKLTTSLLLWYGAITSSLIQTAWLGFELKFYMFESVNKDNVKPIAIRTFQNSFSLLVITYALKYFPLTIVSMVGNLSPLLTVVLAYFILGESLTVEKAVQLVLAFVAVTMMVLGGN